MNKKKKEVKLIKSLFCHFSFLTAVFFSSNQISIFIFNNYFLAATTNMQRELDRSVNRHKNITAELNITMALAVEVAVALEEQDEQEKVLLDLFPPPFV